MKKVFIPAGESRSYETLVTEHLVVDGHLNVVNGLTAKTISGNGVITAGEVSADVCHIGELETATAIFRKLMARRVSAAEVFASDCACVTHFLSAAYVETGRLTVSVSEIDKVNADEVITLQKKHGMFGALLASSLRAFWLDLTAPIDDDYMDAEFEYVDENKDASIDPAVQAEIARTVRQILAEQEKEAVVSESDDDFELKRVISTFKLLRDKGYTLRILPKTPEENAPVFDFEKKQVIRPAA